MNIIERCINRTMDNNIYMTSFELVNQKLKHIFGGIQPQINGSVEFLHAEHRRLSIILQNSSNIFKKIQNACEILKSSIHELQEIYKEQFEESKTLEAASLACFVSQITRNWGQMSQQVYQMKKQIDLQLQNLLPEIKKDYADHKEAGEHLEHYRSKIVLLQKRLNQTNQSSRKNSQNGQQFLRFERNQQKLNKSQKFYNEIVDKLSKKCINFNLDAETLFLDNYSGLMISLMNMHNKTRLSINNWLKTKQKQCNCHHNQSVKTKINKIIRGEGYHQIIPINVVKLYQNITNFKMFQNIFLTSKQNQVFDIFSENHHEIIHKTKNQKEHKLEDKKVSSILFGSQKMTNLKQQKSQFQKNSVINPKHHNSQFDQFTNLLDL